MNFELITDKYASVVRLPGKMVMAQTPTYRAAILDYINQLLGLQIMVHMYQFQTLIQIDIYQQNQLQQPLLI